MEEEGEEVAGEERERMPSDERGGGQWNPKRCARRRAELITFVMHRFTRVEPVGEGIPSLQMQRDPKPITSLVKSTAGRRRDKQKIPVQSERQIQNAPVSLRPVPF